MTDTFLTFLMVAALIVLIIVAAIAVGWAAERRRLAVQTELKVPVKPELVEQAASRLLLDMDAERIRYAELAQQYRDLQASGAAEVAAFRQVIGRLEWILSLCFYDPISGYLDTFGPTTAAELYRKLGGQQTAAAFQARLMEGVKARLYRVADSEEGRIYWLDPNRPQVSLGVDDDEKTDTATLLEARRLAVATASGWAALPPRGE